MKQHKHAWRARETPKGSVYECESYVCAHYSNSVQIRLAAWQLGSQAILYRGHINFVCESYVCAHFYNQYIHKAYFTIAWYDQKASRHCRRCVAAHTDQ